MKCKICGSQSLNVFAHTARCDGCGVLLYYPYPTEEELARVVSDNAASRSWYSQTSYLNHVNFTNMFRYVLPQAPRDGRLDVLDFGGGGGQFALVCKSHLPESTVYLVDVSEDALLDEWKPLNRQIRCADFEKDPTLFDLIFLNDVFEHLADPVAVLRLLAGKLKEGGRLFIDTPRQFWLYPVLRTFSPRLYTKLLIGTVSRSHLQIWSRAAFELSVRQGGLRIAKYQESSEYTQPPDFYLHNMGITNPVIKLLGHIFYRNARYLAANKIVCTLERAAPTEEDTRLPSRGIPQEVLP
jgi:2-polyprenyl-3-methyl-5-hydroxy-6-metoxy-1,4-benzoquinol methylase